MVVFSVEGDGLYGGRLHGFAVERFRVSAFVTYTCRSTVQARLLLVSWLALAADCWTFGPGLGTPEPMPVCAYQAHIVLR